ncbi:MAG: sigma-70 family RNA polymerase sigma factor, partial [Acidobacteria bacterium]|nr:sigma-70 family RNA polymerase sigma factor [Acidobacteriota bacterium]
MQAHEKLVLRTALRIAGNLEDAQDVSQEVFLRLYRHLDRIEAELGVPSWLYRTTVN